MEESGPELMGDIIAPLIKSTLWSALFLDQCGPAACCKAVKRKALVARDIHQSVEIWKRILRGAILQWWAIWLGEVGRSADFLAVPSGQLTCSEPR